MTAVRPRRRRPVPGVRGARVALLVCLALLAVVAPAPAIADDGPDLAPGPAAPVTVTITSISPGVLVPGEDLAVTARVTNTGPGAVDAADVALHMSERSFISRTSLDLWRHAGPDDNVGRTLARRTLDAPLGAGESRSVTLRVPAAETGLSDSAASWGPRGIAVTVTDEEGAGDRLAVTRSFALWFPADEVTRTRVSVLVPLVGTPVDPYAATWVEELEAAVDGRLGRVLDATEDAEHVSWVLDPWLVDVGTAPEGEVTLTSTVEPDPDGTPGSAATDEPTGGPTSPPPTPDDEDADDAPVPELAVAGEATRGWTERLVDAAVGRDVHVLPYGDTDVAALLDADVGDLRGLARDRARAVVDATDLPDNATTDLLLPASPLPDVRTATAAARDRQALVVGPGQLTPPAVLTYTPTGRTTVATAAGDATVLVPDERLSSALVSGRVGVGVPSEATAEDDGAPSDEARTPSPVEAAQDLLAELAVITRERPNDARHMLLTAPRDWAPDPEVAAAQLAALADAPWVRPAPVPTLVGTPDPGVRRDELPQDTPAPTAVTATEVGTLRETLERRAALADMVPEPDDLVGSPEDDLLALVSVAWRNRPDGRRAVVAAARERTEELADGVRVAAGSTVNLVSRTAPLPVRVVNELDQPVTVEVTLRPDDWHLRVEEPVTVTVGAGAEQTVQVPVRAIQSADLTVAVELRTVDGVLVDDSTELEIRVRADWEGIGTAVLLGLLAVLLVIGLVRTIRRGRISTRSEPIAAGPDALSPEAAEAAEAAEQEPAREVGDERHG